MATISLRKSSVVRMDATRHEFKRYRVKISGGGNNSLYVEGLLVLTEKFVVVLSKVGGGTVDARWRFRHLYRKSRHAD